MKTKTKTYREQLAGGEAQRILELHPKGSSAFWGSGLWIEAPAERQYEVEHEHKEGEHNKQHEEYDTHTP